MLGSSETRSKSSRRTEPSLRGKRAFNRPGRKGPDDKPKNAIIIRALRMMRQSAVHHPDYHPGSRPGGRPGGRAAGRAAKRPLFCLFCFVVVFVFIIFVFYYSFLFVCVWQHIHNPPPTKPKYRLSSGPGHRKTTNCTSSQM